MYRRVVLFFGGSLLVGGWGMKEFAQDQQRALSGLKNAELLGDAQDVWLDGFYRESESDIRDTGFVTASSSLAAGGYSLMALGAGLLASSWRPRAPR